MKPRDELETLRHTNAVQAQDIRDMSEKIDNLQAYCKNLELRAGVATLKHMELLRSFKAFRSLLRHLGSAGTEIEWEKE